MRAWHRVQHNFTIANLRRLLVGQPLATKQERHQRLPNILALPVFASDALSSNAYATEEILMVLVLAGSAGLSYTIPIAIAIFGVLAVVSASYRQTILAYPTGASAYVVARENLGLTAGLIAAGALLIDYVLTVAVSVSAGVLAITSITNGTSWEWIGDHRVFLCLICIGFITVANIRGAKESGTLFAIPTYLFVISMMGMILVGFYRYFFGELAAIRPMIPVPEKDLQPITVFLILRAFSSGCAALTGIEAISDGIPAFKPPESINAARTLVAMATILSVIFLGLSGLAYVFNALPVIEGLPHGPGGEVKESLGSVLARHIFGHGALYYVVQGATACILILAANTSYQDFPRLSSILARDSLAPRQLANLGDRLVFQNGILLLGVASGFLTWAFRGEVNHLIPLYAVGVFLSFTLSQSGMIVRRFRLRQPGWKLQVTPTIIGAIATGIVLIVIASVKFVHGAWIVIALIPVLVVQFFKIHRHYEEVTEGMSLDGYRPPRSIQNRVLLLIPSVHRGVIQALRYAQSISEDIEAVHVEMDPKRTATVVEAWQRWGGNVKLRVLKSPWRSLPEPIIRYIDLVLEEGRVDFVTVVIPEFVTTRWWHRFLHNSSGLLLKLALLYKRNVVVSNVRYYVDNGHD